MPDTTPHDVAVATEVSNLLADAGVLVHRAFLLTRREGDLPATTDAISEVLTRVASIGKNVDGVLCDLGHPVDHTRQLIALFTNTAEVNNV